MSNLILRTMHLSNIIFLSDSLCSDGESRILVVFKMFSTI